MLTSGFDGNAVGLLLLFTGMFIFVVTLYGHVNYKKTHGGNDNSAPVVVIGVVIGIIGSCIIIYAKVMGNI